MWVTVIELLRHFVAYTTALSVLVCSTLCMCPAMASTVRNHTHEDLAAPAVKESHQHPSDKPHDHDSSEKPESPPCHQQKTPCHGDDSGSPTKPCDHDGNGHSCTHCDSTSVAKAETKANPIAQSLAVSFFAPVADLFLAPPIQIRPLPSCTAGAPPPAQWCTLLRLHCALII